jgi:hypothetical protein
MTRRARSQLQLQLIVRRAERAALLNRPAEPVAVPVPSAAEVMAA